ncbi:histidine phosphatase superfamily [Zopfochytrium polystomum]|nr:histidine phosphatase superfamily [Zopfochytrium polystomum]
MTTTTPSPVAAADAAASSPAAGASSPTSPPSISTPTAAPTARLVVAMVGLPARGKTYVARKAARYLGWLGHQAQIFNVGNYRRRMAGATQDSSFFDPGHGENSRVRGEIADKALEDAVAWLHQDAPPTGAAHGGAGLGMGAGSQESANLAAAGASSEAPSAPVEAAEASAASAASATSAAAAPDLVPPSPRAAAAEFGARNHVQKQLVRTARVAIYDATNSTRERRGRIMARCEAADVPVMFVEMVCDDEEIIVANIKEVKLSSPDYVGMDPDLAVKDFMSRIKHYETNYEPIEPNESPALSYVKIVNVGEQVIVHRVKGYIQSRIVYFLMNLNITPRCFYFSRHGESEFNVAGKIGGDADLSERGWQYARALPGVIAAQLAAGSSSSSSSTTPSSSSPASSSLPSTTTANAGTAPPPMQLTVWTSTLRRTIQTASFLPFPQLQWKALDELDSGVCDGLTYDEIEAAYPEDFALRDADKFNYRYRGGESYADLVRRLEPVTLELERHHEPNHSILIVGHQAVLRGLYGYFLNYSHDELPYINIPLHTVVKLEPKAYGCLETRFKVDIAAVDTHRLPKNMTLRNSLSRPITFPPNVEPEVLQEEKEVLQDVE